MKRAHQVTLDEAIKRVEHGVVGRRVVKKKNRAQGKCGVVFRCMNGARIACELAPRHDGMHRAADGSLFLEVSL